MLLSSVAENEIIKWDNSLSIGVIIAVIALVSPILVDIINNLMQRRSEKIRLEYQLKEKQMDVDLEMQMHKYDTYYKRRAEVLEKMLYEVGAFLAGNFTDEKLNKALASVSIAYGYADEEFMKVLDVLKTSLLEFHEKALGTGGCYPDVSQHLEEVAKVVSKLIVES